MVSVGASSTAMVTEHARLEQEFARLLRRHAELVAHPEDREGHVRHLRDLRVLIARLQEHIRLLRAQTRTLRDRPTPPDAGA